MTKKPQPVFTPLTRSFLLLFFGLSILHFSSATEELEQVSSKEFKIGDSVEIVGIQKKQTLNFELGTIIPPGFNHTTGRYAVSVNSKEHNAIFMLQPKNVQKSNAKPFKLGQWCKIHGLESKTNINGKIGRISEYMTKTEGSPLRYGVSIIHDKQHKNVSIKVSNLMHLPKVIVFADPDPDKNRDFMARVLQGKPIKFADSFIFVHGPADYLKLFRARMEENGKPVNIIEELHGLERVIPYEDRHRRNVLISLGFAHLIAFGHVIDDTSIIQAMQFIPEGFMDDALRNFEGHELHEFLAGVRRLYQLRVQYSKLEINVMEFGLAAHSISQEVGLFAPSTHAFWRSLFLWFDTKAHRIVENFVEENADLIKRMRRKTSTIDDHHDGHAYLDKTSVPILIENMKMRMETGADYVVFVPAVRIHNGLFLELFSEQLKEAGVVEADGQIEVHGL